jgi:hypothetical protein
MLSGGAPVSFHFVQFYMRLFAAHSEFIPLPTLCPPQLYGFIVTNTPGVNETGIWTVNNVLIKRPAGGSGFADLVNQLQYTAIFDCNMFAGVLRNVYVGCWIPVINEWLVECKHMTECKFCTEVSAACGYIIHVQWLWWGVMWKDRMVCPGEKLKPSWIYWNTANQKTNSDFAIHYLCAFPALYTNMAIYQFRY